MRRIAKAILLLFIIGLPLYAQNVELLGSWSDRGYFSDVWGWDAPDGKYYAIAGAFNGVSVLDVTDPSSISEVGFFAGPNSSWRDIKTYKDYAYIVNDTEGGLLVLDLSTLPDSVRFVGFNTDAPNFHNLFIDTTTALMFLANASGNGSVSVVSLENPENPEYLLDFGTETHDLYVRDGKAFTAEGNKGTIGIYDVSNIFEIKTLKKFEVPNHGYVHNVWLSKNSDYMVTTEETTGKTVKIWDISDLDNIELTGEYLGKSRLPHNAHVEGDYVYISHYTSGLSVVDLTNPKASGVIGLFDTYPENDNAAFTGNWGVYPHSNSGNIYLGDMARGLFVVKFNGAKIDHFTGRITDAQNGAAISGALVSITGTDVETFTDSKGYYSLGYGFSEQAEISFAAFGFKTDQQTINISGGKTDTINVQLSPAVKTTFRGFVKDENDNAVAGADVSFQVESLFLNDDILYNVDSDENGMFEVTDLIISDPIGAIYKNLSIGGVFPFATYRQNQLTLEEQEINEIDVTLVPADVLVINSDPNANYSNFIKEAVNGNSKTEFILNVDEEVILPNSSEIKLLNESYIIWITGDAVENVLTNAHTDSIKEYLKAGSSVLLSGQNIAEHLSTTNNPFLQDWLHINYLENMSTKIFNGVPHPVSQEIKRVGILSQEAANNQESPDAITPTATALAKPIFEYLNSGGKYGAVGIEYQEYNSKLFFAGFGVEAVYKSNSNYVSRTELFNNIFAWFDSPLGLESELFENPEAFSLNQNYPNPFNPSTTIEYSLPEQSIVKLNIFNIAGQLVQTLVSEEQNKGTYRVRFDASDLASGVYFYKLDTGNFTQIRRMVLLQ